MRRPQPLDELQQGHSSMERLVQLAAEAERGYQEDREALVQIILAARRRARKLRTRMRSLAKSLRPWVDAGMPEDGRRVDAAREYVQMAKDLRDCRLADLHGCETLRDLREKVP